MAPKYLLTLCLISLSWCALPAAEPVGHWSAMDEPAGFVSRPPCTIAVKALDVVVSPVQGRPAIVIGEGGTCEAESAPGDGWEALSVVADVFVARLEGNYQAVVCRDRWGGPTGDVFGLVIAPDGRWQARVKTEAGFQTAAAQATPGWHLVVLTYDGSAIRLFVDGERVSEQAQSGRLVAQQDTPLAFGTYSGSGNGRLLGALAGVRLYRGALDADAIAGLVTEWREAVEAGLEAGFWFAQASDTHVTDTRSVEIINEAVDRINADQRVAFSLWLGDLTRGSTADEMVLARLALQRLAKPRHVLRGNHDLAGGLFEREFGPLRSVVTYGGWKLLLVDSNPGDKTPMSAADREWIRDRLQETPADMPLVLCTHHPLMPHTKSLRLAGADEVITMFAEHNLKAVLGGHFHGNQQETVDGVLFTTTACLSTTRSNFDGSKAKGYRLFRCKDDDITTEFVSVRE